MKEPEWIREDVVRAIHKRQLAEHGGESGVRDEGLLASALIRPRNRWAYEPDQSDLAALAAAYAYGISCNHPFVDGNKRTAYVVCVTFLRMNGYTLAASGLAKFTAFMQLASSELGESALSEWIREHLRPVD